MDKEGILKKGEEATIADGIPRFFVSSIDDTAIVEDVYVDRRYSTDDVSLRVGIVRNTTIGLQGYQMHPTIGSHEISFEEFSAAIETSPDKKVLLVNRDIISGGSLWDFQTSKGPNDGVTQEIDLSDIDFSNKEQAAEEVERRFGEGVQALKQSLSTSGMLSSTKETEMYVHYTYTAPKELSVENHSGGVVIIECKIGASKHDLIIGPNTDNVTLKTNEAVNGERHKITYDITVTDAMRDASDAEAQQAAWQEVIGRGITDIGRQKKELGITEPQYKEDELPESQNPAAKEFKERIEKQRKNADGKEDGSREGGDGRKR